MGHLTNMLQNYSDDELLRYVDRNNPEVAELCRRMEGRDGDVSGYEDRIDELEGELEDVKTQLALVKGQLKKEAA